LGGYPTKIISLYVFMIEDMEDSEQLIISGCISGDRASQAKLYNLYARKMMGVCLWYSRNREEAEEILHDGFMRVFTYINKYKGEGSFEGWIRKIMINAALSKYKIKSYNLKPVVSFDSETYYGSVSADFANNYDEKELIKLVQTLSPAYRMVFNLFVFEGMKHREIAEVLKISEGTSKSNLADARRILQEALTLKRKKITLP